MVIYLLKSASYEPPVTVVYATAASASVAGLGLDPTSTQMILTFKLYVHELLLCQEHT